MGSRPLALAAGFVVLVTAFVIAAAALSWPKSPEQRDQVAQRALDDLDVTASATADSLLATGAFADFGVGNGIRLVRVRIVDQLQLEIGFSTPRDILLAEDPKICLVGPYSAPDDAGLEDRCWGDPDLAPLLSRQLEWPASGRRVLPANQAVALNAVLSRGDVRCDYSPGEWVLQVKLNPLVDGTPAGARYLDDVKFQVPVPEHAALEQLRTDETRYCGLATVVYRDQGEPEVAD